MSNESQKSCHSKGCFSVKHQVNAVNQPTSSGLNLA